MPVFGEGSAGGHRLAFSGGANSVLGAIDVGSVKNRTFSLDLSGDGTSLNLAGLSGASNINIKGAGSEATLKINGVDTTSNKTLNLAGVSMGSNSTHNTLDLTELANSVENVNFGSAITVGAQDNRQGLSIKVKGLDSSSGKARDYLYRWIDNHKWNFNTSNP